MKYEYLSDKLFLKEIDTLQEREKYVKIVVLDFNEEPIKEVQGIVAGGGTMNIDGKSSMRRSCTLNFISTDEVANVLRTDNLLSINKKVEIEIGISNKTNKYKQYPIIWFPMGIFIMSQPSISRGNNGTRINMQLKDKMCTLNGECGGIIPAAARFDVLEYYNEENKLIEEKVTLFQIIQELVNHFGGVPLNKIVISDLDTLVTAVQRWNSEDDTPVYINTITKDVTTNKTVGSQEGYLKYEKGDDIGYTYVPFTYPESAGELTANPGDSVTSVLDKIIGVLGNFEYFFDVEGNFIFQEKKNYLNTTFSKVVLSDPNHQPDYRVDPNGGKSVYNFEDSSIISSYSNSPQYNNVKNDFVVWGVRKTVEGNEFPIRYHLAIDDKPAVGNKYNIVEWTYKEDKEKEDSLEKTVVKVPIEVAADSSLPKPGVFGMVYHIVSSDKYKYWNGEDYSTISRSKITIHKNLTTKDWRTELFLQGALSQPYAIDSNYYYMELANEWPKLYDIANGKFYDDKVTQSSSIDFFLDMIDASAEIGEISISSIGRRTKVVNDNKINCIFEPNIPEIYFYTTDEEEAEIKKRGKTPVEIKTAIKEKMVLGGTYNSAYNLIKDLVYQYTNYNETITIQALPVYYLEPNTRITVTDTESSIQGDYIINSISLPIDINGMMSINATKAEEKM